MPLAIIRHAIDAPAIETKALRAGTGERIVTIECILTSDPEVPFAITVDAVGTRG